MGNWNISIKGVGQHHNQHEEDVEQMTARFVAALRRAGHSVTAAVVTTGGEDNVTEGAAWAGLHPKREATPLLALLAIAGLAFAPTPALADDVDQALARAIIFSAPAVVHADMVLADGGDVPELDPVPEVDPLPRPKGLLEQGIELLFAVILLPLLRQGFNALKAITAGKAYAGAVDVVEAYVFASVAKLKSQIDAALADDGKVSQEELRVILDALKRDLPADALTTLSRSFGAGLETWLVGLVMDAATQRQKAMADAAGTLAAADVDTLEKALAARRARLVGGAA